LSELARRFLEIFAGLDRAYGRYVVPPGSNGAKKVTGPRVTIDGKVTVELWERHLEGEDGFGIGIVPIRDDATCVFGAIDVDVYPIEHAKLIAECRRFGIPLMVGRSKSGGAHLWLFLSTPAPAELVVSRLREFATLLGHPRAEVFPKQIRLAGPEDNAADRSMGSWINAPYSGGDASTRYVFDDDGVALTAEAFASRVAERAVSPAALAAFRPAVAPDVADWFAGGPPCLQALSVAGFGDWQNNGLFNIAVYLKKVHGKVQGLADYNKRFMDPAPDAAEVRSVAKSVGKRGYSYKCKEEPICSVCDRATCLTRKYGVGNDHGNDSGVTFGDLVKLLTDPPTWIWEVNAKRVHLSTEQLTNQAMMRKVLVSELDVVMRLVPSDVWDDLLREKLRAVVLVEVPTDATPSGQLLVHLQRWCTSRVVGKHLDDLLRGLPYTDPDAGRTFFCSSDFLGYLAAHRVGGVDEKDLYTLLRPRDLDTHVGRIKGKTLTYWSIPEFEKQTEEHAPPKMPAPERM